MRKPLIILLFTVGFLLAGALFPGCDRRDTDQFYPHELVVSSSQSRYSVGDTVILNFEIRKRGDYLVRLYKERHKSLYLRIRGAIGDKVDSNDNDFVARPTPAPGILEGEFEVLEFPPNGIFRLTIKGLISKKDDGLVLDFGEFGTFKKKRFGRFMVWGYWLPVRPSTFDSLEDDTNTIIIEIVDDELEESIESSADSTNP